MGLEGVTRCIKATIIPMHLRRSRGVAWLLKLMPRRWNSSWKATPVT